MSSIKKKKYITPTDYVKFYIICDDTERKISGITYTACLVAKIIILEEKRIQKIKNQVDFHTNRIIQ